MSQEGNTLSLYPSSAVNSAGHFPNSPAHTQTMNSSAHAAVSAASVVPADHHSSDDEKGGASKPAKGGGGAAGPGGKSRRELPAGAVATLKAWLLSPEHFTHPYPTPQDQIMLMHKTGIDKKQLKNWFTNARRRIWKPMLKKQLEAGKLAAAGGAVGGTLTLNPAAGVQSGGMTVAVTPGLPVPRPELSSSQPPPQPPQQEMYTNFQQAQLQGDPNQQQAPPQQQPQYQQPEQPQYQQQQQQQVQYDQNTGQPIQQQPMYDQYGNQVYDPTYQQQPQYQQQQDVAQQPQQPQPVSNDQNQFPISNSIGSLAPLNPTSSLASFGKMIKTDSHAVLMELFARDQDLVRQAAGKGGVQVQQQAPAPATAASNATRSLQASGTSGTLRWANGTASSPNNGSNMGQKQHSVTFEGVPSLSSWPHFSSVSSLNNLGGLQGVKSITNLSAADLSSQGNLNKMGNLAQVKSVENMGRGDSFAFLEVFFDDKSGMSGGGSSNGQRGLKRDYDDAIGLSLDGDDGASPGQQFGSNKQAHSANEQAPTNVKSAMEAGAPIPAPLPEDGNENIDGNTEGGSGGGKLKRAYDDALAARGLIAVRRSCEKLTDLALPAKMQRTLSQEYIRQHNQGQPMGDFFSSNNSAYAPNNVRNNNGSSQQLYPMQPATDAGGATAAAAIPNSNLANESVAVPSSTKCALCTSVNVDTQLRPCGHMFHGRCLKPSLQNAVGPPKCPICSTSMQSAILAVPSGAGAEGAAGAPGAVSGAEGAAGVSSTGVGAVGGAQ
mmetsp:Transcript_9607/g.20787  ORF Transcript_9607/g.20787 Transcript_9607/m.20787 type:complete len:774 (+) Transcript_9607:26-2347(+)